MRKLIFKAIILIFLFSCDYSQDDYMQFAGAYKKILIAREIYQNDSAKSNFEVRKIYKEFGFNEETFKEEYDDLTQKNPKIFQEILDSLRENTQRELTDYHQKLRKNRKHEE